MNNRLQEIAQQILNQPNDEFSIIFALAFCLLYYFYFKNMKKIKCICINNKYKNNLNTFLLIHFILNCSFVFIKIIYILNNNLAGLLIFLKILLIISTIITGILIFINTRNFLDKLKKDCKCSETTLKSIINILNIIQFISFGLIVLMILFFIGFGAYQSSK
jgi:hypothetical protein